MSQYLTLGLAQAIGTLLISLLPIDAKTPSPFQPTPEVLIQAVDSVIDVYADEDASYDVAVFRQKGFLAKLVKAVPGVRAAVSDRLRVSLLMLQMDRLTRNSFGLSPASLIDFWPATGEEN